MAFGFPAHHTATVPALDDTDDPLIPFRRAIKSLGWSVKSDEGSEIRVSTSTNLRSWGERLEITLLESGDVQVKSRCALPTQCFDWGKNRANVESLLRRVNRRE